MEVQELRDLQSKFQKRKIDIKKLESTRNEFLKRFPADRLGEVLTLDTYVIGKPDTFCKWLEQGTKELGRISIRSAADYGIYFDNKKQMFYAKEGRSKKQVSRTEAQERFSEIRKQITDLLEFAKNEELEKIEQISVYRHVKEKILSLYFPEKFLSVFSENHINHFLEELGLLDAKTKNLTPMKKKHVLLEFKNKDEIMKNWSPYEYMHFLYEVLPPYNGDGSRAWLEKTIVSGRRDREEGDYALGKALWSPQRDKRGADIYRNMRLVRKGDCVLHLVDNKAIVGISRVATEYDPDFKCLSGTEWDDGTGNNPGYLIRLTDFIHFENVIPKENLLNEKHKNDLLSLLRPKSNLFYNKDLKLRQGAYLTRIPSELLSIINEIYKEKNGSELPYLTVSVGYPSKSQIIEAIKEIGKERIRKDELLDKVEQIVSEKKIELRNDWKNKTWENIKKWAEEVID